MTFRARIARVSTRRMSMRRFLLLVLHIACFAVVAYIVNTKDSPQIVEVVRTDTLRVTDTVLVVQPICTERRVTDTLLIHTIDTLMREVVVSLPREERVYEDSAFRAVVSGYRPSLDTMQIYQRHRVVKVTKRITPPRWSLGLQGGLGVTPKGFQPYIGVGVAYRLDIK